MNRTLLGAMAVACLGACSGDPAGVPAPGADASVDGNSKADSASVGEGNIADFFLSTEVLGRPTSSSASVSLVPRVDLEAFLQYGTTPGGYEFETAIAMHGAAMPFIAVLDGLAPDKPYYYRTRFRSPGGTTFAAGPERSFHTARPKGRPFVFTVQADPHLDDRSDIEVYRRALANQLEDSPDFMIDLGDTFMCEKHRAPFTGTIEPAPDQPTVVARYLFEHGNFGLAAHSVPLFLVNGNHEGEAGWLLNGTPDNVAIWATLARKSFFPAPLPDDFYSGVTEAEPLVGQRGSFYSWEWGDALFVVLDPFWYTLIKSKQDGWVFTLGEQQYRWLSDTLQNSVAAFKFVFLHNLLGGLDTQGRGGIEAAPFFEWGGANLDGTPGFDQKRPGWGKPVHQLLVDHGVTAVFHGHDHVYVKQELDGIVYQELPQPSTANYKNGPALATAAHYENGVILSSSGHLRVSVNPAQAKVEYVRAYRPQDETGETFNGQVSDAYTLVPR